MPALIALRAAFGQDEASHGTTRYRVDAGGLVHVPPEAALHLTRNGGFAAAAESQANQASPRGGDRHSGFLVRLRNKAAAACSYCGVEYRADENGDVLLPAEAAADLAAHGFAPVAAQERPRGGTSGGLTARGPGHWPIDGRLNDVGSR